MSKVLVTGGAGFIGSHTCERLLARGDEVVCVDILNDYYSPKVKEHNIEECNRNPNFKFYKVSITDKEELRKIFETEKPEKIIHLAAWAGVRVSIENPGIYVETNVNGTFNILELAKQFGIKDIVLASSSSVYGERNDPPFHEEMEVNRPISPYAATKRAGEIVAYTYHHLYDMNIACLRFFTVYGERGRPDMAPLKFVQMLDRGETLQIYATEEGYNGEGFARDYTYIADTVSGVVAALDKNEGYEIYNLGCSNPVPLHKFVSTIANALEVEPKLEFVGRQSGDVTITSSDITKAKEKLGYKTTTQVEEGVKKLVDWYRENKQLYL